MIRNYQTTYAYAFTILAMVSLVVIPLVSIFTPRVVDAAPNAQINYQGKLLSASNVAVQDGVYNMRFWLLTSPTVATTSAVWTESLTGGNKVQVTNGLFSVMLGSTSALTSVDFNQTLYLGVEIGGSTTPVWDGEMSPRKILGTVPAAFEAENANTLDDFTSSQFVRTDATSTIASSTVDTLLTITQNGTGDVFNLFDGTNEIFSVVDGGNIGIGTTTPSRKLTIQGGDFWLGGNLTATGTATFADLLVTGGATTTSFGVTSFKLGSDVITDITGTNLSITNGVLSAAGDGVSQWLYNGSRLTPSSTVGIGVFASSTIGDGTGAGGLTINGGATTTGNAYFAGNVGIGTTTPSRLLTVQGGDLWLGGNIIATGTVALSGGSRSAPAYSFDGDSNVGMYHPAEDTLSFVTGGVDRMRLTSNGNIGIGTTTPSALFTLERLTPSTTPLFQITSSSTGASATSTYFTITSTGLASSTYASTTGLTANNAYLGALALTGFSGGVLTTNSTGVVTASTTIGDAYLTDALTLSGGTIGSNNIAGTLTTTGTLTFGDGGDQIDVNSNSWDVSNGAFSGITNLSVSGSSTIGGGTGATGLTISGGATTTGNAYFALKIGIGSTSPSASLTVTGSAQNNLFTFASSTGVRLLALDPRGVLMFGSSTPAGAAWGVGFDNVGPNIFINGGPTSTPTKDTSSFNNNIALGYNAFSYPTTTASVRYNIAIGVGALYGSSTNRMSGSYNQAIGDSALISNTSGSYNIAQGPSTLWNNTTGSYNIAQGALALYNNITGTDNLAQGYATLLSNTTGSYNIAQGSSALYDNTTGSDNIAQGRSALSYNTTGNANTAVGRRALFSNTTGASSTALGYAAGRFNYGGSHNLYLGDEADSIFATTSNSIAIGSHALVARSAAMVLGGTGAWNVDVVTGTSTPFAKLSVQGNYGSTTALFDVATTTSSTYATSSLFRVGYDGNVSIGSSSPLALLTIERLTPSTAPLFQVSASTTGASATSTFFTITSTGVASSTYASTTGLTANNAYLANVSLTNATATSFGISGLGSAGILAVTSGGGTYASTTVGDGFVSDTLTVSGGTIGSNNIAGTLTTTGTLTLGDGGDQIDVNSNSWDVSNGAFSGITNLSVSGSSTIGGGTGATGLTINGTATTTALKVTSLSDGCLSSVSGLLTSSGVACASSDGVSQWLYNGSRLTPSSTVGIGVFASSTIGGGTGATGLTISGGATTTGNAYFGGRVGIGTSSPASVLDIYTTGDGTANVRSTLATGYSGMNMFNDVGTFTGSFQIGNSNASVANLRDNMFLGARQTTGQLIFIQGVAGTEMARFDASGDLGIGTTTPSRKLTVAGGDAWVGGNLTATGTAQFANLLVSGSSTIGGGSTTTGLTINGGATTTGRAYFADRIGIGTNEPTSKLTITDTTDSLTSYIADLTGSTGTNGNSGIRVTTKGLSQFVARASGFSDRELRFQLFSDGVTYFGPMTTGTTDADLVIRTGADSGSNSGEIQFSTNGSQKAVLSNAGNFGIGSTTPSRLLTVAGDIHTYNNIAAGSSTITYASSTGITTTNLYTTNFNTTYASNTALTVSGNSYLTYASTTGISGTNLSFTNGVITNSTSTNLAATAAFILGSDVFTDLTGSGLTLSNGVLSATGDGVSHWLNNGTRLTPSTTVGIGVFASSTIGGGTGATGLTISGGATTTGNAYFAGNVGIGTNVPSKILDVWGDLKTQKLFLSENQAATSTSEIYFSERPNTSFRRLMMYGAPQSDSFGFVVAPSTTTPQTKSDINIGLWATDIDNGGTQNFSNITLAGATESSDLKILTLIADTDRGDIVFMPDNVEFLRLSSASTTVSFPVGYVGIGSTTPSRKLTVAGEIYAANLTATGTITAGSSTITYASSTGITTTNFYTTNFNTTYASNTALTVSGNAYLTYASTTGISGTNLTYTNATTSNLVVTGVTSGLVVANSAGFFSASTTIGDTYIADTLTVSGGTIGSNNIAGTLTTTGTLTLGDGGDQIDVNSNSWDVSNGAFSGITNLSVSGSSTIGGGSTTTGLTINGGATTTLGAYFGGRVSLGSTSPESSKLTIQNTAVTGSTIAGIKEYFQFTNSTQSAIYYGDNTYIVNAPTATSTLVGGIIRVEDTSALGNTVRAFEAQAHRGTNTKGENTGLSGFGRTFGVRGTTLGDAGDTFLPAGVFAETTGTTQGNALRAYSGTLTTEDLVSLFHDTSNFIGTGLQMNFGNSGGSFAATSSAKFVDFQVGGTSKFIVAANGSTTIGDGTVNASLQIPFGGICVDNDGSCISTTTGQIRSVTSATGNSDLAEMYFSSQSLHAGEIVALSGGLSVARAKDDTEENIIGVVSTKPGLLLGFDDVSLIPGEVGYPIGLKGRVPIKLSTENGPIKKGDRITLSSIPGIGMKATASSRVVGIALEDYDGSYGYSDTFFNQFGDDLANERMVRRTVIDPRSQDGCYYGGGSAQGEKPCKKDTVTKADAVATVVGTVPTREEVLRELRNERAIKMTTDAGKEVYIGQAIMFIELTNHIVPQGVDVLAELTATSSLIDWNGKEGETLWDRVKSLAQNFVDGVLTVAGIKADRVEVQNELCVDGVCLNANDLRALLQSVDRTGDSSTLTPNPVPEPEDNGGTDNEDQPVDPGTTPEEPSGDVPNEAETTNDSSEGVVSEESGQQPEPEVTEEIPEEPPVEEESISEPTPEPEPESSPGPELAI